nr:hypothetical protein BaRGS_013977 [Batillaria attramentaria]
MVYGSMPDAAKVALLREAVKSHRKYTDEAIAGQAVDRHLLGLKLAALESGRNIPELFLDTGFTESTYFRLSTSQETRLNFAVTAYHFCPETDSDKFANVLKKSLLDMHDLLAKAPQESKL